MNISWGYKITFLYMGFVAIIVTMVALSVRQKVDLVATDYYAQELNFQERINQSDRSNALSEQLSWDVNSRELVLHVPTQFSNEKIYGSIFFFRPSDVTMDKTISFPGSTGKARAVSTTNLNPGIYKMEITWEAKGQKYFNEGIINIK